MKMNAIRLAAAVLAIAAAPTAMTADWVINDNFTEYEWGTSVNCAANIGYGTSVLDLNLSQTTMEMRFWRGEDIYRPTISLDGDASQGSRRPTSQNQRYFRSQACVFRPAEDGSGRWDCEDLDTQFRVTYSLSGVRDTQQAWVFNTTWRYYYNEEDRERYSRDISWSRASVSWLDYPDELFDTNEAKSLRINMSGSRDYLSERSTTDHVRHQRINYSHGAEVMKLLRACIDRHIAAGRVTPPGTASIQEIRSGLEREARARMEARRPR